VAVSWNHNWGIGLLLPRGAFGSLENFYLRD